MPEPVGDRFDPGPILRVLVAHRVEFVLIGGLAGLAYGSAYPTFDVDVVYARDSQNLERLVAALQELQVTLRGAPSDLPFQLEVRTLEMGANLTFDTPDGALDILAEPSGSPPYERLLAAAKPTEVGGVPVLVASIDDLIAMKRAAARPKDERMLTELIVLAEVASEAKP